MAAKKKISIILAEDQHLVRQGVNALLSQKGEFQIIGEAADGLEAIRKVVEFRPDLLLLDLAMPKMNGVSVVKEIKQRSPKTKVMILTLHSSDEYILAAFQAGADGYCLKNDTHEELVKGINQVVTGKRYVSPELSERILEGYLIGKKDLHTDTIWDSITQREREVLKLVAEGHSSHDAANLLCISPKTVDKHRANLMKKLKLHNVAALTTYAIKKGLVEKS